MARIVGDVRDLFVNLRLDWAMLVLFFAIQNRYNKTSRIYFKAQETG